MWEYNSLCRKSFYVNFSYYLKIFHSKYVMIPKRNNISSIRKMNTLLKIKENSSKILFLYFYCNRNYYHQQIKQYPENILDFFSNNPECLLCQINLEVVPLSLIEEHFPLVSYPHMLVYYHQNLVNSYGISYPDLSSVFTYSKKLAYKHLQEKKIFTNQLVN